MSPFPVSALAFVLAPAPANAAAVARSQRSLAAAGFSVQPWPGRAKTSGPAPVSRLILRAGTWLSRFGSAPTPPDRREATPCCAIGLPVASAACQVAESAEALEWQTLQTRYGGDFNHHLPGLLPFPPALWLNGAAAQLLEDRLQTGTPLEDAWPELQCLTRIVRWQPFDVYTDPRRRSVQLITSLQRGGAERLALELTLELRRQAVPTLLLGLGRPTRRAFPTPTGWVDLASLPAEKIPQTIAAYATAFGADLLHGHLLSGDFCDRLELLGRPGWPLVQTIHNTRAGWPSGLAERLSSPCSSTALYLACSQAVELDLRRSATPGQPSPSIRTLWNGIDPNQFSLIPETRAQLRAQTRAGLGILGQDLVLLALANPRPQKRLERLPGILAEIQARLRPKRQVHLLCVGEASNGSPVAAACVAQVKAAARSVGWPDRVHWCGPAEDVRPFLAAADVLVNVSDYEGLSLAQLEAVAAGLPVVATEVGGAAELANQSATCLLLPVTATAKEFAAKILEISAAREQTDRTTIDPFPVAFTLSATTARHRWVYERWVNQSVATTAPPSGLVLVTNNFSTGGAQSSARRLLLELARRGHRVRAVTLQESTGAPTPGTVSLRAAGIPVLALPTPEEAEPAWAIAQLFAELDRCPPAALVCWNALASHKLILADALTQVPVFDVSPGEMFFDSLARTLQQPNTGLPIRTAAQYGRHLAGVIVKYTGERPRASPLGAPVHVIRNGVPLLPLIPRRPGARNRVVLGTTARLNPHKHLALLLAAFRQASGILPDIELRIAGGTEPGCQNYLAELQALADGLPVKFLGEVTDVPGFLAELDMFVMISEPAGCPNATLEAMAAGLPVIATDHGGASEQVVDGVTGRLVKRTDVSGLAAAMKELAENVELRERQGTAGRARIEAHFSIAQMVDAYERVFGLNNRKPGAATGEPMGAAGTTVS